MHLPEGTISTKGRIQWWIDHLHSSFAEESPVSSEESSQSQSQPPPRRYNTRKHRAQQTEQSLSPNRRALLVTSRNAMPKDKIAGGSKGKHPHRDPVKLPPLDTGRGQHSAGEDLSSLLESPLNEVSLGESAPALPKTGGTTVTGTSTARSKSPTKDFFDWQLSDWPVERFVLDGQTAEEAGGFLVKYRSLRSASEGDGVIPKSFKV